MSFPAKDKDDVLDYVWDWASWLAGDTIASAQVTVSPHGLTVESQTHTASTVTVWVSGGSETYRLTCRITTAGGRTKDDTQTLRVKEQ